MPDQADGVGDSSPSASSVRGLCPLRTDALERGNARPAILRGDQRSDVRSEQDGLRKLADIGLDHNPFVAELSTQRIRPVIRTLKVNCLNLKGEPYKLEKRTPEIAACIPSSC